MLWFFVPLFLSLSVQHLYLRENVFGWFLFWCFFTVESYQGTEERKTDTFLCSCGSFPLCLFLSFITPLAAALLYPKKIPVKATFTSCCWDRDFMACQPCVSLLNSTCAALQMPKVFSCLFHQRQMRTGNWCLPME